MPTKHRRIFQRRTRGRPDANQLETFLNGAEARSFAEAARQLSISQPSCLKIDDQVPAAKLMRGKGRPGRIRSEEHTSELQSLMRTSYAVFCLKKKTTARKTT